jgi:hypothetical protein
MVEEEEEEEEEEESGSLYKPRGFVLVNRPHH